MKITYISSDHTAPILTAKYAAALGQRAKVEVVSARFPAVEFRKSIIFDDSVIAHVGEHFRLSRVLASLPVLWRHSHRVVMRVPSSRYFRALLFPPSDVYVAADPDDLRFAWLAATIYRKRLVYIPFEYFPEHSQATVRQKRRWAQLERRYAPHVHALVSLGDKLSREYELNYGLHGRVHTIYSSLPRAYDPGEPLLRRRIKVGASDKIILYQGLVARIRGIWDVLAAMPFLADNVHFVVIGFGEEFEAFRRDASSSPSRSRVHVLDAVPQSELMRYTRDADVGIIPIHDASKSYRYCNPGKLFEYIAAGLPLAVSNLDQLAWYVRSRSLGEVFTWGSATEIVLALRRLLDDSEYRLNCAANCRRNHAEEACWDIQSERLQRAVLGPFSVVEPAAKNYVPL